MDPAEIETNLKAVGRKLVERNLIGEILLLGGAYMLLVMKSRSATKDIDAYFATQPQAIREATAEVARERGLPEDWLNEAVNNIHTPSPEYIFAMKAEAARAASSDFDDLRALRDHLRLDALDQAIAIVEKYIPADRLSPKTKLTLETLYAEE